MGWVIKGKKNSSSDDQQSGMIGNNINMGYDSVGLTVSREVCDLYKFLKTAQELTVAVGS